ncbi:MAG: flagellar motor protein MotB [Candidatus Brocadiia bacterium]
MKSLRWGACLLLVGSVAAFSGCRSTGRWLTPSEYDEYNTLKRLNQDQSVIITSLTNDKVSLTQENDFLKTQLQDKGELLAALKTNLENLQRGISKGGPELGENVETFTTPSGDVGIRVKGDVLFASGEAKLKSSGEKVLKQVAAELLRDKPNKLAIRGFTDSDPIKKTKGKWEDNFDLSGHRALAVLEFLEKEGIAPARLHFEGYGQYALVTGASGTEDKAKSRRAEIILLKDTVNPSEVPEGTAPKPAGRAPKPSKTAQPMTPK